MVSNFKILRKRIFHTCARILKLDAVRRRVLFLIRMTIK